MAPVVLLLLGCALGAADAKPKPSLAVFTLEAETGVQASTSRLLTDALVSEVRASAAFSSVVSFRELEALLSMEQQRQLTNCSTESCVTEATRALGVDQVLVGNVGKLGESFLLNLRLLDTRTGGAVGAVSKRMKSSTEEGFLDAIPSAVSELLSRASLKAPDALPVATVAQPSTPAAPAPVSDAPPSDAPPSGAHPSDAPPADTPASHTPSRRPLYWGGAAAAAAVAALSLLVLGAGVLAAVVAPGLYVNVVGSHRYERAVYAVMAGGIAAAVVSALVLLGAGAGTVGLAFLGVMQ